MQLDYPTYQHIQADKIDYAEWYGTTYEIFKKHPLNSLADFWKIVAFAYSWMPTIPTIRMDKLAIAKKDLLTKLKQLKSGDANQVASLFEILVPVINNSYVGTSKVLHFIAPRVVPIYDSRVVKAWNCLFYETELSLTTQKGEKNRVQFYIQKMQTWQQNCAHQNIQLRDIELALFQYAKTIPK